MSGTRLLAIVLGLWVLMRSVNQDSTGRTLIDHLLRNPSSKSNLLTTSLPIGSTAPGPANTAGEVNPIPGATGSRLDQGFDATSKTFVSPVSGKVVASVQTDPGWQGGGYLAIADAADPNRVYYMAEGLSPIVQAGQAVTAGQQVAIPRTNPYNGVYGNIEIGRANPAAPRQPLAQVVSNPAGMVMSFYNWLRSLGGPAATSTSSAGHA